jgi:hypothetical protein
MLCTVQFPPSWVNTIKLDDILLESRDPHSIHYRSVRFVFPDDCEFRVDALLRLLSLVNQICCEGVRVTLVFEGNLDKFMNYLVWVSFFDLLDPVAEVLPYRPKGPHATLIGKDIQVVEVLRIGATKIEQIVVSELVDRFIQKVPDGEFRKSMKSSLFTVLGELISNIQRHASVLELDGFVALQRFQSDKQYFCIAASDSSIGLIETLRPVLKTVYPKLAILEDSELIKLMFTRGVSRFGDEYGGTGLSTCRRIAAKFNATIEARQNFSCFRIEKPARKKIAIHTNDSLPYLWGTHICINFSVDL